LYGECSNGRDDDGDMFIDDLDAGCYDTGAYYEYDNDEIDTLPECSDFFDNDGDTLIDFGLDPECSSASDNDESA